MNLSFVFLMTALLLTNNLVSAGCGDGTLDTGEQCDDFNSNNNDGCDSTCKKELYYKCDNSNPSIPSICKYEVVISLTLVGIDRITSSNTAVFLFKPNYQLDVFKTTNFGSIFATSIAGSSVVVEYVSQSNLIKLKLDYIYNLEGTIQSFKIYLTLTNRFWNDSQMNYFQLHGTNYQVTYHNNLWLQSIFSYVFLSVILVSLCVGFASIFFQKWIALELIQTYQAVYYSLMLINGYPYEFTPLLRTLRYANGYDDIYKYDFLRSYTLPSQLNGLKIQKQFMVNINLNICLIGIASIVLVILAIYRFKLKLRLQSQVNRQINKRIEKVNRYFAFMFGQVFVFLVLMLMFKIISSFVIQLSTENSAYQVLDDEINSTLALMAFLILFSVVIYVFNWYIMIPDSLKDGQVFHSLKFSNMKFFYPVMYLTYQVLFICLISIYYRREYILYIMLAGQVFYFCLLIYIMPYNTPRKINRNLHNFTIIFNQFILIFMKSMTFRWRSLVSDAPKDSNSLQFQIYLFLIFILLICSTLLTIARLVIFNKDVNCTRGFMDQDQDQKKRLDKNDSQAVKNQNQGLRNDNPDNQGLNNDNQVFRQELQIVRKNSLNNYNNINREQNELRNESPENLSQFLNDKYTNWKKNTQEELNRSKNRSKVRRIRKTNTKLAELIKTPLEQYIEMKLLNSNNSIPEQ